MNHVEAGSFRDRNGRIVYQDGQIFRLISQSAKDNWDLLGSTGLAEQLMQSGQLVRTTEIGLEELRAAVDQIPGSWVSALRHERIRTISYAYEWSFSMLKDAALLQLELLASALEKGIILKDATPYNIQWSGVSPVFIDTPSFEPHVETEPWVAYRQFCELFLYPLMLQAYRGISLNQMLRSSIDGIEPSTANQMFSFRDRFRPGVFTHVFLQSKMQGSLASKQSDTRGELRRAGFNRELIKANVKGLQKLVRKLCWQAKGTEWADYSEFHNYSDQDHQQKEQFVAAVCESLKPAMVWDLGANTGQFSRIAAAHADYVVAADIDPVAVEKHYQYLKLKGMENILPLVMNLADPSPNWGWRGTERTDLATRSKPELTLCLALIHHVVITANIPMSDFIDWLADLESDLMIEYVSREDEQVKKLLLNKHDQYEDYDQTLMISCLEHRFNIDHSLTLGSGLRTLYFAKNKQGNQ